VYAGGAFTRMGSRERLHVAAVDENGAATAFNPAAADEVYARAPAGTTVYAGGRFSLVGDAVYSNLVNIDVSGRPADWLATPNGGRSSVRALLAQSGRCTWAGITRWSGPRRAPASRSSRLDAKGAPVTAGARTIP
jgi:hypothetical protein